MKKWMTPIIVLAVITILAISAVIFIKNHSQITGEVIESDDYYFYTKAICNETNYCQDYEITCQGNKTIEVKPITGAAIQQPLDWQDSRIKELIGKECGVQ